MSDQVITPVTSNPSPTPAGTSGDNGELAQLREKLAQKEREAEGFKRDMLSEREKRQALERSGNAAPSTNGATPNSQPAQPNGQDPMAIVKPLFQEVVALRTAEEERRALSYFVRKENIKIEDPDDVDAIKATPQFQELREVIAEHKLESMPMRDGVKTAHELLQKKRDVAAKAKAEKDAAEEAARKQQLASQQTVSGVGLPPAGSKVVKVSRETIAKQSAQEYSAMLDQATKNGETILVE